MNGEKAYAHSEGIRGGIWDLLPDHHSMAQGGEDTGRDISATIRSVADPGVGDFEGLEGKAETGLEEGKEAQGSGSDGYGRGRQIGLLALSELRHLPTCGDCAHFVRCRWLIGRVAADEPCDWAPSRFIEKGE
jgi:hypothetical protein